MTQYVAFLRGINVGGHQVVKMTDLADRVVDLGFERVSTFRASGNVRFESVSSDAEQVRHRLRASLRASFGERLDVLLRTLPELQEIVRLDPFSRVPRAGAVPYVTFVTVPIAHVPSLPLLSPKKEVELFFVRGRDVFCWALPTEGHHFGFPQRYLEKLFEQPATTRNWSTVTGVFAASFPRQ
jgi:uncharacterized protein (DUF1697 family)